MHQTGVLDSLKLVLVILLSFYYVWFYFSPPTQDWFYHKIEVWPKVKNSCFSSWILFQHHINLAKIIFQIKILYIYITLRQNQFYKYKAKYTHKLVFVLYSKCVYRCFIIGGKWGLHGLNETWRSLLYFIFSLSPTRIFVSTKTVVEKVKEGLDLLSVEVVESAAYEWQ